MSTQSRHLVFQQSVFQQGFGELILSKDFPSDSPFSLPAYPSESPGATSLTIRKITLIRGGRKKQENVSWAAQGESRRYRRASTISKLPDNVLLEIFDLYRKNPSARFFVWPWHVLAHVCRRWRQIVYGSPRRLNLRIFCRNGTPVRTSLGIWPAFPIVIIYGNRRIHRSISPNDEDNVLAALEHPDRVCTLSLNGTSSQLEKMATVMQQPFPVLRHLILFSEDGNTPVLPAEFLGGSAPYLQNISLSGTPYPALPKLLFSANCLTKLYLIKIPPTGYISPKTMAACLIALPRLEYFTIGFQLATPRPNRIHPPPLTRTVLSALTSFIFQGASEYLEDLVARIYAPQLNRVVIHYLNQLVDFQVTRLSNFIDHSVCPELTLFKHAYLVFSPHWVHFTARRHTSHQHGLGRNSIRTLISCRGIDWQVSHMAQVLSQISSTLSNVVHLSISLEGMDELEGVDDVEWPHLLLHFSTIQTLYVSWQLAGHVARAIQDITTDLVTEVLPSLALIRLAGKPVSSVEKFVAVRQLSGRPVTVVHTHEEFMRRRESYISK